MTQPAYTNCRFYVKIDGSNLSQAVFSEVSGLQMETVVQDYEEGGRNDFVHRLPGRTKVSNLTLKRGITKSNEFFNWYMQTAAGKIKQYSVSVVMYDAAGHELLRWDFDKAYPIKWIGPQFSADGRTMAVETLELAHSGLKVN